MALVKYAGGLLRRGDALANSLNCCCDDDPCDCNQDLTYYFMLEFSGFADEHLIYTNPITCPGCPLSVRLRLEGLNGTYFVPFTRDCSRTPVRFSLTNSVTLGTAIDVSERRRPNEGCFNTNFDAIGTATLSISGSLGGLPVMQFINISLGGMTGLSLPVSFDFPVPQCSDEPIEAGGTGSFTTTNYHHGEGCGSFTDTIGTFTWSLISGEAP